MDSEALRAVAVYCASSLGNRKAFYNAAISLGRALVEANRPLVYGGGSKGIMGTISGTVLQGGGKVTGIVPFAMVSAGGENEKSVSLLNVAPDQVNRDKVENIVVDSMHDRKVEMAKRAAGFIGLPGGFGTFEEILEVITWTQLGIHDKPVIVLNILSFYEPLRELIKNAVREGYIQASNESLLVFVDGPARHEDHDDYNWGKAALDALESWKLGTVKPMFDWTGRMDGGTNEEGSLGAV